MFTSTQLMMLGGATIAAYMILQQKPEVAAVADDAEEQQQAEHFCSYKDCAPELQGGSGAQPAGAAIQGVAADIAQSLQEQQFLDAQQVLGIDTKGQTLANPVYDLRGGIHIDKIDTLFNQSSIMPQDVGPEARIQIGVGQDFK